MEHASLETFAPFQKLLEEMQELHSILGLVFGGAGGGAASSEDLLHLRGLLPPPRPPPPPPHHHQQPPLKCPRCESTNTKFCYYNNYNLSQPRHFCKSCRRYWTRGGVLRNVPVGGASRKSSTKKPCSSKKNPNPASFAANPILVPNPNPNLILDPLAIRARISAAKEEVGDRPAAAAQGGGRALDTAMFAYWNQSGQWE